MQARIVSQDEMPIIDMINCVAFEGPWEASKPEDKKPDAKEKEPFPMHWWLSEENGEPCGCVGILPAQVRFDGHIVGMSGIGGVATLPQHRRKGAIRACMQGALNDMYQRGDTFAALYPFSRAYYRQFGFEDGPASSTWTVEMSGINLPDVGGRFQLLLPGDDFAPLYQLYQDCTQNWNLAFEQPRFLMWLKKQSWMKDKRYLYLWRDENDAPAGAIMMAKRDGAMDCTMSFALNNFLLFKDARAMTALLRFAKTFAADYDSIKFNVPQGLQIGSMIAEANDAKCESSLEGMIRIVNVKKALELCKTTGEGGIVLKIADGMIEENNKTWKITLNPNGQNRAEETQDAPDAEMPIGELSQLILGAREAGDIPMMPRIRIANPTAPFEKIFPRKTCHTLELF